MHKLTRRDFLRTAIAVTGALAAYRVLAQGPSFEFLNPVEDPLGAYPYRGWEPRYKDQWTFDTFGRSAHSVNCTGNCTWRGYVKDGIRFKEEQFADYPEINAQIPTYNPRGCQKGANHKEYVYGPQRVKYPLIRADYPGNPLNRGSGNFRRATWAEALSIIASKVVDTINTPWVDGTVNRPYSPDQLYFYAAIPAKHFITLGGGFRLANLIGAPIGSFYDWYCDLPPGEPMTWGEQTDSCESADWFNSKFIMLQGANLLETRIPDAHYFTESRYKGCKTVVVSPEYNPVATHADTYLPIKPGTDAAFCLGMANVIVNSKLYDEAYIKQFTDMPFLVYTGGPNNGKFVRVSQARNADGSPVDPVKFNQYYVWDRKKGPIIVPGTANNPGTLDLGAINPLLELKEDAKFNNQPVKTVFMLLKKTLKDYSPDMVEGITGINKSLIGEMALNFATLKPARIIEGAGTNHYFHNDLINRSQILVLALTGNIGFPGSGFDHYVGQEKIWPEDGFFRLSFPYGRPRQRFQNTTLWTYIHSETQSDIDGFLPRPLSTYISESVSKGWMPLWPKGTLSNHRNPKVMFIWGANYLNQAKGANEVYNKLWPKADLIVDINFRMDTTARYADVILPAASHFEKFDINSTDLTSWVIPFTPVIDLLYESKPDWEIWRSLAAAIQGTGFPGYTDDFAPFNTNHFPTGILIPPLARDFSRLLSDFDTLGGLANTLNPATSYPPISIPDPGVADQRDSCQWLLDNAPETAGMDIKTDPYRFSNRSDMSALPDNSIIKHPQRVIEASEAWTSDVIPGVPYYGFQRMTVHKRPVKTQTGRQQFYLDHDWLIELGEQLPVHKEPLNIDQYPLRWITPHGRWSIHSTWRDAKFQLRLQRGRPIVYLSPNEAAARGLKDNDLVTIFNNHGELDAHLCISHRMPDGMAQMYHGWERHTFSSGAWQTATVIRINPTQLIGKYGQMAFRLNYWGPTGNQKDTRVEIRLRERQADNTSDHWLADPCAP